MPGGSRSTDFDRSVLRHLRGLGRRLRLYLVIDGIMWLCVVLLGAVLLTLLMDRTFHLGRDMRVVQLASLSAVLILIVSRLVIHPMRVPIPLTSLALLLERWHPQLQSRLITAVEFTEPASPPRTGVERSSAMIQAVIRQAEEAAAQLSYHRGLAHTRARRNLSLGLGCLVVLASLCLAARPTMAMWFQRNVLLRDVEWPQRNRLTVQGLTQGVLRVPRGEDATITATVDQGFEPPMQVFIRYESASGQVGREQMPASRVGVPADGPADTLQADTPELPNVQFLHTFERLAETLRCQVHGGDAQTDWFTIEVVDRPQVVDVTLNVTPPAYTRMEAYDLRAGQTVAEVLKGSIVQVRIRTNRPVREAMLMRDTGAGESVEVRPAQRAAADAFIAVERPMESAVYHFRLVDGDGLSNESERVRPVQISVRLVADRSPRVKLQIKGVGEMVTPAARLPIDTDFSDDYGLAAVSLVYGAAEQAGSFPPQSIPGFEPGPRRFQADLIWSPTEHGFKESDRVVLHAEARDADDITGPHVGQSPSVTLRLVSREEVLVELSRREQEYRQDFERLVRTEEELLNEWLGTVSVGDRRDRDAAKAQVWLQMARRQRDYGARANALRGQFEQVLSEWRINQLATPEVEERLGRRIVAPMELLHREKMPVAADRLETMARTWTEDSQQAARLALQAVLTEMKTILASMLKWEGFQEAVTLLRDVQKMQRQVSEETDKRIERAVSGEPAQSQPARPSPEK
ncbi:MAG TPA: hypothetical protein PKY77_17505 [Phycisphaerae bacterium]|nr:hypothetical protein [Phycisphaerae bacterium]HRY68816.1 hypothetical protein [Phycisphaerae bacterium]HSA27480.1 hypothetical protein [Phycisphaerae bacterium]